MFGNQINFGHLRRPDHWSFFDSLQIGVVRQTTWSGVACAFHVLIVGCNESIPLKQTGRKIPNTEYCSAKLRCLICTRPCEKFFYFIIAMNSSLFGDLIVLILFSVIRSRFRINLLIVLTSEPSFVIPDFQRYSKAFAVQRASEHQWEIKQKALSFSNAISGSFSSSLFTISMPWVTTFSNTGSSIARSTISPSIGFSDVQSVHHYVFSLAIAMCSAPRLTVILRVPICVEDHTCITRSKIESECSRSSELWTSEYWV